MLSKINPDLPGHDLAIKAWNGRARLARLAGSGSLAEPQVHQVHDAAPCPDPGVAEGTDSLRTSQEPRGTAPHSEFTTRMRDRIVVRDRKFLPSLNSAVRDVGWRIRCQDKVSGTENGRFHSI